MAKTEYWVGVDGDQEALRSVAPYLQSDDIRIIEDHEQVWLLSSRFDGLRAPFQVAAEAARIMPFVRAAMRLAGIRAEGEYFSYSVRQIDAEGRPHQFAFAEIADGIPVSDVVTAQVNSAQAPLPKAIPVEIALDDEAVAWALQLLAKQPNWYELAKVVEVIEDDVGGGEAGLAAKGWVSANEMKKFSRTANAGDRLDARHAKRTFAPPEKPMSLHDGIALVYLLVAEWLAEKDHERELRRS